LISLCFREIVLTWSPIWSNPRIHDSGSDGAGATDASSHSFSKTPQINQPLQQGLDCSTVGQHNSIPTKAEQPSTNLWRSAWILCHQLGPNSKEVFWWTRFMVLARAWCAVLCQVQQGPPSWGDAHCDSASAPTFSSSKPLPRFSEKNVTVLPFSNLRVGQGGWTAWQQHNRCFIRALSLVVASHNTQKQETSTTLTRCNGGSH